MRFKRRVAQDTEEIPMSSMADIAFLLIIFFMLTTVFDVEKGIIIDLPETSEREAIEMREIVIMIDQKGQIYTSGKLITIDSLGNYVRSKLKVNSSRPVVIKCDKNTIYQNVADVMDELLAIGVTDVALPTLAE